MRKHRSLQNLNDNQQQIQRHILFLNLNTQQIKQVNVNYLLSAGTTTSQLP